MHIETGFTFNQISFGNGHSGIISRELFGFGFNPSSNHILAIKDEISTNKNDFLWILSADFRQKSLKEAVLLIKLADFNLKNKIIKFINNSNTDFLLFCLIPRTVNTISKMTGKKSL
jgi:hypothetical protein